MLRTLLLCSLVTPLISASSATDSQTWQEVDIIPMPRHLQLTGRRVSLDGMAIVLGNRKSRQDEIGANWINDRLSASGAKRLNVVDEGSTPERAIIIGTLDSNRLIGTAGEDVSPTNPGERGYEIRTAGSRIYLVGVDPIGALYACVTFAELLAGDGERVVWREASVRDWPDFIHCPLSGVRAGTTLMPELHRLMSQVRHAKPTPEFRERYLATMKAHYDRLLRWKVSYIQYRFYYKWTRNTPPEALALIREAIEYGKERGIGALMYAETPFVCLVADHPDVERTCIPKGRYPEFVRCWSMDDLRRQTADSLASMVKALGITDIGFHDTDTGGFESPARWNERCERCRERWGDDYVAATVHKHRIYYDALKRQVPDIRVHFTFYPYNITVLTPKSGIWYLSAKYGGGPAVVERAKQLKVQTEALWRRLAREVPADATFCIRETIPETVQRFRELVEPHGVFTWYGLPGKTWRAFLSVAPSWVGTFYGSPKDFLYPQPFGEMFVPLQGLAVREYSWNTKAPGASDWAGKLGSEQRSLAEPKGDIYRLVYPHIIRNLFGRDAAPELVRALNPNMEPFQIFGQQLGIGAKMLKDSKSMTQQAELAEAGADALDAVWARCGAASSQLGMTDFAFRRFVYLREVFHSCRWMARARAANLEARELARAQDMDGADAAIDRGLKAVAQAEADFEQLIKERPKDPVLMKRGPNRYADGWRVFMPGWDVDMDAVEKRLIQTRKELTELGSLGAVPKNIVDLFEKRRTVRAAATAAPISVDGQLTEAAWQTAYPVECFFVHGKGTRIARAHTRVRLLYDDKHLYVGFTSWMPGGVKPEAEERGRDEHVIYDDSVELFLMAPSLRGDYVHFMANAAGSIRHQRCRLEPRGEVKAWRSDNEWTCAGAESKTHIDGARWEFEMRVPLASLGAKQRGSGWLVNVCRNCSLAGGERELSSTQRPTAKDFHDVRGFRRIEWYGDRHYRPDATIEIAGFKSAPRTMADRIGTVATFKVEANTSQVLHNVELNAEAYAKDGSLQARKRLLGAKRVFYRWQPIDPCEVAFEQQCESGGIRLTLSSDEGLWERWIRFGGWPGTKQLASLFAPGSDEDGSRPTPCLQAEAYFPSEVTVEGRKDVVRIFRERVGTIELWLRAGWPLPPRDKNEYRQQRQCLLHFGIMRRQFPQHTNCSSLSLIHYDAYGFHASITSRRHVNWAARILPTAAPNWRAGEWHHLAVVWDADADRADWLRIYLDGKRASTGVSVGHEDRLDDDKSVRLQTDSPYVVQLGCLNTGRLPAKALIDDLRISRRARYVADFTPPEHGLTLDGGTSALFRFDGHLEGEGMTPDGQRYVIDGVAGVLEYH